MDYKDIYRGYDELYKQEQLEKLNIVKKYINVKKEDLLLDVGCGTGISTNFFDCKSIGVDSCFEMLNNGICAKAENLPFKDNVFDVILSITAIHNFNNAEKSINEIKRVCKGKIVITLLKKAKKFKEIKALLNQRFKFMEIDSNKDLIFIYNGN